MCIYGCEVRTILQYWFSFASLLIAVRMWQFAHYYNQRTAYILHLLSDVDKTDYVLSEQETSVVQIMQFCNIKDQVISTPLFAKNEQNLTVWWETTPWAQPMVILFPL